MKKEIKFIELPGLPQQTTKKGHFLSIAKYYFSYKGKVVVITGAANDIGRALAQRSAQGCRLSAFGLSASPSSSGKRQHIEVTISL